MSQNIANASLPTPTATQDWTTAPEEAIQLESKDNQETADAKYAKHQHCKQVKKECKAAEEAAAHEREEAEHWEKECQDQEEHSYAINSEMEYFEVLLNHQQAEEDWEMNRWSKMLVVDRLRVSVPVLAQSGNSGLAESSKVKGKAKACDPVLVGPCAQCVRAGVECTFELARAMWATTSREECTGKIGKAEGKRFLGSSQGVLSEERNVQKAKGTW
ncbi:hypothetical protein EDC04DRAFT_2900291 [Pisolithus marmoratus]|nr:hypothetical protein EDC04DRAFT_2900291 [Pisolithus marmoratus]